MTIGGGAGDQAEPAPGPRLNLASLVLCLLGNFLLRAAAGAAGTLISLYLASLQRSGLPVKALVVGSAAMLFYAAELLGSLGFGLWSDLKGRKPFMVLGPVLGGLAVQAIFVAPTIPLVLLARMFQGLSTASSVPSTLSYLSAETGQSPKLQGRVMSSFEVASIVGMAGGFAAGGVLWDALHHTAFLVVVGAYAASLVLLLFVRDYHSVAGRAPKVRHYLACLRSRAALRLIPAWVAVNAIVGLWFSQMVFQMGKASDPTQLLVGGFTGRQIGLYTGGLALLFVVGIGLWSLAFGRLRATQIMSLALGGLFALVGLVFLLNHTAPGDHARIIALIALACAGLLVLSGFTPAALVYLAGLADEFPETRGSIMGLYSVFLGVGQFLGSGLGGYFADWRGVDGMIVLTALLGIVSALCVATLVHSEDQYATPQHAQLRPRLH